MAKRHTVWELTSLEIGIELHRFILTCWIKLIMRCFVLPEARRQRLHRLFRGNNPELIQSSTHTYIRVTRIQQNSVNDLMSAKLNPKRPWQGGFFTADKSFVALSISLVNHIQNGGSKARS